MNSYALRCQEPSEWVPGQNQPIIMYKHFNTLTWQNVAVILAWGMWAQDHWTVWNELIGDSTIKKLYQSINNTKYHIATVPTNPLSHVWQHHYKQHIYPSVRSPGCLVLKWKQTSHFPNEIHPCRTLTHCTPSRGNPLMSGRILTKGINPAISNILTPCKHSLISSKYVLTRWCAMDRLTH